MWRDIIIYTPMYVTFFWAMVLLLTRRENNRAKFFLGIFMAVAFLIYCSHAIYFKRAADAYQLIDPVYTFASLSVYPLYYWYIKLLSVEASFRWRNLRLLIPATILAIASFIIYQLMAPEERLAYVGGFLLKYDVATPATLLVKLQQVVYALSRIVFAIQVVWFLIRGRQLVLRYNSRIANFYSNLESKTIRWVNWLLYSFVVTSLMSVISNFIGRHFFFESLVLLLIPSFVFSVLLFFIGYLGHLQNHTVVDLERDENRSRDDDTRRINSDLLKARMVQLFTMQKIYRQPELKITQVAMMLGTNRSYISSLINTDFQCSFSDFVNRYRVEEAKKIMAGDQTKNFSLNYVAEKSGFGSVGTFIRAFKEIEGVTPGKFRLDMLGQLSEETEPPVDP